MADGDGWHEVGRGGRLRAPRDAGGGGDTRAGGHGAGVGGGGGGRQGGPRDAGGGGDTRTGGQGAGGGGGERQGAYQGRPRPKAPDIRAKVEPKPHTVMLNCHRFQELPTEIQVADWFGDHLFTGEVSNLLAKVGGLDIEEREKRIMVQLTSSEEVDHLLTRMGEEGVEWPEFVDPVTNQPIKIKGYSTDKSSLRVTLLDVPRDIEDNMIKEVMSKYGTVQEVKRHHLKKPGMEHIIVNRVSVKLARDSEVDLPTTIYGLGSSTNGGDRSIWRVTYTGAPRRCYRCGNHNHVARDCRRPPITMQDLEKMPVLGEAQAEGAEDGEAGAFPKSFAAVVRSTKFLEAVALEKNEAERLKTVRQEMKDAEERRKEHERKEREEVKKAKLEERRQEEEARQAAYLAEMGKTLEKAALRKKYIKNLHDQTQAEVREAEEYENEMERMTREQGKKGLHENAKRPPTSPALLAPLSKKLPSDPLSLDLEDGGT